MLPSNMNYSFRPRASNPLPAHLLNGPASANGALRRSTTGITGNPGGKTPGTTPAAISAQYESSSSDQDSEDEYEAETESEEEDSDIDSEEEEDSSDSQAEEVTEEEAEQEAVNATLKAVKARSAPIPVVAIKKKAGTIKRRATGWIYIWRDPSGKEFELIPKSKDECPPNTPQEAIARGATPVKQQDDSDKPQPSV